MELPAQLPNIVPKITAIGTPPVFETPVYPPDLIRDAIDIALDSPIPSVTVQLPLHVSQHLVHAIDMSLQLPTVTVPVAVAVMVAITMLVPIIVTMLIPVVSEKRPAHQSNAQCN